MRKVLMVFFIVLCSTIASGQIHVTVSDPENWTVNELRPYVGQTVIFDTPMIICSNYRYNYTVSPRRIFSPTNQAIYGTPAYQNVVSLNNSGSIRLNGVSGYHRTGEKIYNLRVTVYSDYLEMRGGEWHGNTREELEKSIPNVDIRGTHTLLVCGMNLEYYLNQQYDPSSSMGPDSEYEHQKQRTKISKALAKINADIYGLVEIQQGDSALKEIAEDLTSNTGRKFTYVRSKTSASGSLTQSSYVYCSDVVETVWNVQEINEVVPNRKRMIAFREKSTGEMFVFSINHFKAKSGSGYGDDANHGQGGFNASRTTEAKAVVKKYNTYRTNIHDDDILVMGDLNAYGKEDPILVFLHNGLHDLHREFHADSSYSYTYANQAGYLDHAICSASMLRQVTGMAAYHINSDELDDYTYDKSNDLTMFRCSDHDPVIVGLRLDSTQVVNTMYIENLNVYQNKGNIVIHHAEDIEAPAYYRIYTIDGRLLEQAEIVESVQQIESPAQSGVYIVIVYSKGNTYKQKIIRP